jgi:hypothetical protein
LEGRLVVFAAFHHLVRESVMLGELDGPTLAFVLDGGLALVVAYAGYWLLNSDLGADQQTTAALWAYVGALLFVLVVALSIYVRRMEGRTVAEPAFQFLLAADAGAIGGFLAGMYGAKSRREARRAKDAIGTLAFVNDVLRHDLGNQ